MIVVLNLAWHLSVVIKENKNNSLQFAKVFPTEFLKLPICQFSPSIVLHYTVINFDTLFQYACHSRI